MADAVFLQPAYLEKIVEAKTLRTWNTPILDMFFKRKKAAPEGFVRVPKEKGSYEDILAIVDRGSAIPASELKLGREYVTYDLKLFGDLKVLKPSDVRRYQEQLAGLTGDNYNKKRVEIANDIIGEYNRKVDLTREYMAGSALTGVIKDKDGNTIEEFDIPKDNDLGNQNISNGSVKIYKLLRAMVKRMREATNYSGAVGLILGENAYDKILDSEEYQTWAKNQQNALTAEEIANGVEGYMLNKKYPFLLADAKFYSNGSKSPFFDADSMILAPLEVFGEYYANIDTNKGSFSKIKHIDKFEVYNPDGEAIRLQCSSMPIVTLPNAIIKAKIS